MRKRQRQLLVIIIFLFLASLIIDLPKGYPVKFKIFGYQFDFSIARPNFDFNFLGKRIKKDLDIKYGLDLAGGTHLVLDAEMKDVADEDRDDALSSAKDIIEKRINFFGVNEPVVVTSKSGGKYRIIVELPGVKDTGAAIDLIGRTAQLSFREEATDSAELATGSAVLVFSKETGLTGEHLKKAVVDFDQNTSEPQVALEFNSKGAKLFEEITKRNIGKQVAIFLDEMVISAPVVNETIAGGRAVITGDFAVDEAKNMVIMLNAGALPVPIEVVEQRTIGATLGSQSVAKSLQAGFIGLLMVIIFMGVYYGRLGLIANMALVFYGLLTLAIYKLIPVTLTLPGIAGFVLSVGMAVDANILIFERFKEEMRAGKPWRVAIELGFGRAWDSIKDANTCTIITCLVLLNPLNLSFLNTSGMVRGFALTLLVGVVCGLFTGVVVTRTLIRALYRVKPASADAAADKRGEL